MEQMEQSMCTTGRTGTQGWGEDSVRDKMRRKSDFQDEYRLDCQTVFNAEVKTHAKGK